MKKVMFLACLLIVASLCLAATPVHPNWVTFERTSPTTGTIRWSSEPSTDVGYYYLGLHSTDTVYSAPSYCDPDWNVPGGYVEDFIPESPGVLKSDVVALDPVKNYYAYVAAVELAGWSWSAYSSWEPPINLNDYPEGVSTPTVTEPTISIMVVGGDANSIVGTGTPGPLPGPAAAITFSETLQLIGAGGWTVDYTTTAPVGIWYSYTQSRWFIVLNSGGHIIFNIPVGGKDIPEVPIHLGDATLPVELSSFTATLTASNYVTLAWTTQSESNLLGYRVYRTENQNFAEARMITPIMIPATNTSTVCNYSCVDHEVVANNTYWYWLESVELAGEELHGPISVLVTDGEPGTPVLPETTEISNIYPNPFRAGGTASMDVSVKSGEKANVNIYNARGQVVRNVNLSEGFHQLNWDGTDSKGNLCASGTYFYRISSPSGNQTRKLVLIK